MKKVTGLAAPLPQHNVDTDIIMPKRFLRTITREGLAEGVFADLRFNEDGTEKSEFVLNQPSWRGSTILVVGDNFGCGSSREHAVWGLRQSGVEAIIGTGFAGIFFDNSRKNGLALAILAPDRRDQLMAKIGANPGTAVTVNILEKSIKVGSWEVAFEMDEVTRQALLKDRDDTLDTLKLLPEIQAYEASLPDCSRIQIIK
jgi:3-isopropylmalate/(R)-2-methylmalate dehydratase small subunit|tara:strand:+ start:3934 stop:4536 length:603 start_codon:yes stop_codon:yes gene_type:complete